ncbi:hypothetical protein [Calidifontibacter indicus]
MNEGKRIDASTDQAWQDEFVVAVRLSMRVDGRLIDPVDGTPMR